MLRSITRSLLYGGLLLLFSARPSAATDVDPGPVSGTWTVSGSPYVVLGHITVPDGETLTIDAGVEVRFDGPYALDVQGRLLVEGSLSDTVLFTTSAGREAWGHIEIGDNADAGSVLSYCRIEHSNATAHDSLYQRHGGGIYMKGTHGARLEYSTVADCVGAYGGGIYADGSVTVQGCLVRACQAVDVSRVQGRGGGIAAESTAEILDCTIVNNTASFLGGGIGGSSAYFQGLIDGCAVAGNHSGDHGGGMAFDHATAGAEVVNNLIYENTATRDGGGVYFWYGNVGTFGHNTIARNEAPEGAGIAFGYTLSLTVESSIIAFNEGEATNMLNPPALVFDCVCAFGNEGGDTLEGTAVSCLAEDPRFCGIFDDDYALCANSPCCPGGPSGLIGALDVGCGDCGSAVQRLSWGKLKSLYR